MKSIISIIAVFIIGVANSVGASVLSDAARLLPAGSWIQLTTTNFASGTSSIFWPPAGGSTLEFTDEGYWNPINNTVMILGASHGNPCVEGQAFAKYTDSNNTWSSLAVPDTFGETTQCPPNGTEAHEYDHAAIDTVRGDFYHRRYFSNVVRKFSQSGQTWSDCSTWGTGSFQVAGALEYFPDRDSLVMLDGDFGVWELSLASGNCLGTWNEIASTRNGGFTPQLTGLFAYHVESRYSPACHCIVMGGGNNSTSLYRYNSDGTFTSITAPPAAISQVAIPQSPTIGTIMTVDPISGKILIWNAVDAGTKVYQLDAAANTWTTISLSSPIFPWSDGDNFNTVAIPISSYGVIMFVQASSAQGGAARVYLYRHSSDFANRCAQPGVVRCFSFDTTADLGVNQWGGDFGYFNNIGACGSLPSTASCPTLDTGKTVEGHHAIKMTTHNGGDSSTGGQWYGNFSTDLSQKFGANQNFYVQWQQYFDTAMMQFFQGCVPPEPATTSCPSSAPSGTLTASATTGASVSVTSSVNIFDTYGVGFWLFAPNSSWLARIRSVTDAQHATVYVYTAFPSTSPIASGSWRAGGPVQWKQAIISAGDNSGCATGNTTNCTGAGGANELVPFTRLNWHYPMMYNSQTGSTHVTAFAPFQVFIPPSDFNNQNGMPSPFCLYSQENTFPETIYPPTGNCFSYVANEWMGFQVGVNLGPLTVAGDEYFPSRVRLWVNRQGQPSQLVIDWNNQYIAAGTVANLQKYGKIWLLPHMTNKSTGQTITDANTWYGNIVISTNQIADPGGGSGTITPPTANPVIVHLGTGKTIKVGTGSTVKVGTQ